MIYKFDDYLLEKKFNKNKVAIFLLGIPASGKSTFMNKFILPSMRNFKMFDSDHAMKDLLKIGKEPFIRSEKQRNTKFDKIKKAIEKLKNKYDIILDFTNDEIYNMMKNNLYIPTINKYFNNKIETYINTSSSDFVYDSTGNSFQKISKYINLSQQNGFEIILITIKTNIENAITRNLSRSRTAQIDFQVDVIENSPKLNNYYKKLYPNQYYEYDNDTKKLFKLINNKLEFIRPNYLRNKIEN
jgi:predicted kinase